MSKEAEMPTPRRIYGWLDSHLSIARYYGGCSIDGKRYVIRYDLKGQPLEEVVPKKKPAKKRRGPVQKVEDDLLRDVFWEEE